MHPRAASWWRQRRCGGNSPRAASAISAAGAAASTPRFMIRRAAALHDPARRADFRALPRPICLAVGRVAVEKNTPAFLDLHLPGSKVVIGDGPMLAELRRRHPDVHFLGKREGVELARLYASAD